jgi:hypothetical protein
MTTFPIESLAWMDYVITDDIFSSLIRRFAFLFSQHNLEIISYICIVLHQSAKIAK